MPQTSVGTPELGQEGTFATSADRGETSRVAEEAVAVGKFVVQGTADTECALPSGSLAGALGVAMLDQTRETPNYSVAEHVAIAEKGEIFVIVEDAVSAGADVFVRTTAGGSGLGSFRSDATGATQLPNAYYKTSAGVGETAILKLWR